MKPRILVRFKKGVAEWMSDGWKDDAKLMAEAKRAINEAKTKEDVIENLEKTFEVIV